MDVTEKMLRGASEAVGKGSSNAEFIMSKESFLNLHRQYGASEEELIKMGKVIDLFLSGNNEFQLLIKDFI